MPGKKLTARKRAELKRKKIKEQQKSSFPVLIILLIIVIGGIAGAYFIITNIGTTENGEVTNGDLTNFAPTARKDVTVVPKNAVFYRVDVLANDFDPDNDGLNLTSVTTPSNGNAEIMADRKINYSPNEGFSGNDSFTYTITDGKEEATSTVHVVVAELNPIALIDTSKGTIAVELFQDKVPNTVSNFINLSNDKFYDGLVFHRVINDFMIQGGGFLPDGTKKESPYGSIDLEINPEVRHGDGTIAMARTSDPNSASSQFFINDGPQPHLEPGGVDPNGYTAFGEVIFGIDVVREIAQVDTTERWGMQDWPTYNVFINSITIENLILGV
jgi:cyclophilin family peptidyl-prolyl cis-trans isomerase